MSVNAITFCSLINREVFKSGDLSDLARADLEAYFKAIKQRFDSGDQFPYDLEELVPTVFALKHKAVEAISGFNQGTDFISSPERVIGNNPNPKIIYRLAPSLFEFLVASKSKPIFDIYHRVFHTATSTALPKTFSEALQLAADQARRLEQAQPKVEYYDRLIGSQDTFTGEEAAKVLRTSVRKLFEFLRSRGILTVTNLPMQLFIDRDFMRVQPTPYKDFLGRDRVSIKTLFTQPGLLYVRGLLDDSDRKLAKAA
jgi:phage antirepressor YoqD-like protein